MVGIPLCFFEEKRQVRRLCAHHCAGVRLLLHLSDRRDDIGERFHPRAAIDVGNDVIILVGVLLQEFSKTFRR